LRSFRRIKAACANIDEKHAYQGPATLCFILSHTNIHMQPFNVSPRLITGNTPVKVTYPNTSDAAFIRVLGVDGKVWQTSGVPAGSTVTSIDITHLARGSYFIVWAGNGSLSVAQVWKE
jgi:hypothetical protein